MTAPLSSKRFRCNNLDVVGFLRSQDRIWHEREFWDRGPRKITTKLIRYIIQYGPVYFPHSENWAVRTTLIVSVTDGNSEMKPLTETVYINKKNIDKFRFPGHVISQLKLSIGSRQVNQFDAFLDNPVILEEPKTINQTNQDDIQINDIQ